MRRQDLKEGGGGPTSLYNTRSYEHGKEETHNSYTFNSFNYNTARKKLIPVAGAEWPDKSHRGENEFPAAGCSQVYCGTEVGAGSASS